MRPHSLPAADRAQESRESCKWRTYTLTRCKKHTCSNLDRKLPCSVFLGYAAWEISSCKLFSLFLSFMSSCGLILFLGFYASHQLSVNTCKLTGNTKAKLDVHAEKAVFFFFYYSYNQVLFCIFCQNKSGAQCCPGHAVNHVTDCVFLAAKKDRWLQWGWWWW